MTIPITPCESTNVAGFGYDQATKTLAVRFKSGGEYHYPGVDPSTAEALRGSKSVGRDVGAIAKAIKGVKVTS